MTYRILDATREIDRPVLWNELTPAMLDAGLEALDPLSAGLYEDYEDLALIWCAMEAARRSSPQS